MQSSDRLDSRFTLIRLWFEIESTNDSAMSESRFTYLWFLIRLDFLFAGDSWFAGESWFATNLNQTASKWIDSVRALNVWRFALDPPSMTKKFLVQIFQIKVFCVWVIIFWNFAIRPQMTSFFFLYDFVKFRVWLSKFRKIGQKCGPVKDKVIFNLRVNLFCRVPWCDGTFKWLKKILFPKGAPQK